MTTIAVIPARAGSKGIPRKNMRIMNGKPLIAYAIENAINSNYIDDIVITTDSPEIIAFASQYPRVYTIARDPKLSHDAVTLDPVIHDAVIRIESATGTTYDTVVTLQPTSPLLSTSTLDSALRVFENSSNDTIVSVVNSPHLSWRKNVEGTIVPNFPARLNRQQLPPEYYETGAFVLSRRGDITPTTRFGKRVGIFEVPAIESIDIDTRQDWVVAESTLASKTIAIRVDGYREIGMGHIYRALVLAYSLIDHEVIFISHSNHRAGIEVLRDANMPVIEIDGDSHLFKWLNDNHVDVFIEDCLDTTADYVRNIKKYVKRFVSFEDLGSGARLADAVINAIYEGASPHRNTFVGKNYVCLRDEFLTTKPSEFAKDVKRVLVLFGGADPSDFSSRIYRLAQDVNSEGKKFDFTFILGPGYPNTKLVDLPECGIEVLKNVVRVSDYMRQADIAFSSQGRTTFELATMGVPTIVLAQNEREQLHEFAQMDNGFINLGLGSRVSDKDIMLTFSWLVNADSIRREMRDLMLRNDLTKGIRRVKAIILEGAL